MNEDEILDNLEKSTDKENSKRINNIVIGASLIIIATFFLNYFLRSYLISINIFDQNGMESIIFSLIILIIIMVVLDFVVKSIIKIDRSKKTAHIAIYGGTILFYSCVLFRSIFDIFILKNELQENIVRILGVSMLISIFGFLFVFIKAAKIKNENIILPSILLLIYFILMGILNNYTSV